MTKIPSRRDFLLGASAIGGAALGGFQCFEIAKAAAFAVPVVDRLDVDVLIDSAHNIFQKPQQVNGIKAERIKAATDYTRTIHNQWGLSLFLTSQRGEEKRHILLDFGYTPEALINNLEVLGIDPRGVDALIVSHGHHDHFGGLTGFLKKYRSDLRPDLKLYAGGEDNFCARFQRGAAEGQFTDFGVLDRREIEAEKIATVLAENPTLVAEHAFTTGKIKRDSFEKVLPNTSVKFEKKDGLGCDASHYTSAELQGKVVPDQHIHEHATVFNVRDRGLVVFTSCGHAGIINTIKQAQEVSGVQKLHALVGGFHLGPAPQEYIQQTVAALKEFKPDAVIPMHCSGNGFIDEVRAQIPGTILYSGTGIHVTIGA